jgi:predicted aconitase with swiveling domain
LSNTANIVLAPGAVIGHPALTSPMYLTIRDLGSAADLFYGLVEDVVRAEAAVTIGAGTPFRGLSTGRANQKWSLGTIHVAAGTSEIALQGLSVPGNVYTLTLGQGSTAGGPVIHPATPGTVNAKLFGNVTLNDDTACFGDTSTGRIIHFQVASGATLGISMPEAMGSGTGVATCEVLDGGTLSLDNEYGINGSTTIRAGGLFKANDSGGLVGTGALTFESGSILELTTANAFNS